MKKILVIRKLWVVRISDKKGHKYLTQTGSFTNYLSILVLEGGPTYNLPKTWNSYQAATLEITKWVKTTSNKKRSNLVFNVVRVWKLDTADKLLLEAVQSDAV
jgi:hypothetical protein